MNKLTDDQLVALKTALTAGTSIGKFLEDEEFDVKIQTARMQLFKKYGEDVIPLIKANQYENLLYQTVDNLKALVNTSAMKGKKTKFKTDLKAMINKL
jgi:hypothetical protein